MIVKSSGTFGSPSFQALICIDAVSQDGGGGLLLEQEMGAGRHKMLVGGLQLRPRARHALTFTPGGAGLPALPPGGGEAGAGAGTGYCLMFIRAHC